LVEGDEIKMSEEHDLKKSESVIGQLLPIIHDSKGRIVDGLHRKETNPEWKKETWDNIKTDEDYWKARAHLNFSRRNAHEKRQEKIKIVNNLADIYIEQGKRISGPKSSTGTSRVNEVLNSVIDALEGAISASWIRQNIDSKYIQDYEKREKTEPSYRGTPEESIFGQYGEGRKELATKVIEDLKEKAREEAKKDPTVRAEIVKEEREKLVYEIKKEYPSNRPRVYGPRYYRNVVNTFYRIRGWGIPMVLSMGRESWNKTLPYVQGIHDWTDFLLMIDPETSVDKIPDPPELQVSVDKRKIVEVDFQIVEDK